MENIERATTHWDARFFFVAGCFMLLNTAMLWIRLYSGFKLTILWPAIPAIAALGFSILALIKLNHKISAKPHVTAIVGVRFAFLAAISLAVAALWIFSSFVFFILLSSF